VRPRKSETLVAASLLLVSSAISARAQESRENQYREIQQGAQKVHSCAKLAVAPSIECRRQISLLLNDDQTRETAKLGIAFSLWMFYSKEEVSSRRDGQI
jgi:hypothetical protein